MMPPPDERLVCQPSPWRGIGLTPIAFSVAIALASIGSVCAQSNGTAAARDPGAGTSFNTRHARYVKADWASLPGWSSEAAHEALSAFRNGCANLGKREGWASACESSRRGNARDAAAARTFFEQNFDVLQLRQPDDSDTGVITGYFEPLLRGSRSRSGAFVHPVYAMPDDLLYLDARELATRTAGKPLFGRVRERSVEPVGDAEGVSRADPRQGIYLIDAGNGVSDIRDKRIRMRVSDDRIVPYPTRQEIERSGLRSARPIAWVDSAEALYSMQIQGSGKIQLADGTMIRVAYAEQNGHPFLPKVSQARTDGVRTRGVVVAPSGADNRDQTLAPQVQKLIDYFLSQEPREIGAADVAGRPADRPANRSGRLDTNRPGGASTPQPNDFSPAGRPGLSVSSISDPSYVFFRQIADSSDGPIGALGVPLTAGRSVAVDPRTTPLGAPVFVASADSQESAKSFSRLMVAQDTGGAIRGPVRADYFWGFGRSAGTRAFQMKDSFRMWVLIPKGLDLIGKQREKIRTRSIDGSQADECLIADSEFCAE